MFRNVGDDKIDAALRCLGGFAKKYHKNEIIRSAGEEINEVAIVVRGIVHVVTINLEGDRRILIEVRAGHSFGESVSFSGLKHGPYSVIAATDCVLVFLRFRRTWGTPFRELPLPIVENLVKLLAEKSMMLHIKNDILSRKTTREKLLSYLSYESKLRNSKVFRIHFSREQLADFLSVNRSAMSRELSNMRNEGLLDFKRNVFTIKISNYYM